MTGADTELRHRELKHWVDSERFKSDMTKGKRVNKKIYKNEKGKPDAGDRHLKVIPNIFLYFKDESLCFQSQRRRVLSGLGHYH